ncbi:MAG TPA: hypothetical protein DIW17_00460 [Clostridiales bacterium]|nr:hypothetical protein [Clostridiales bacterium]
MNNDIYSLIDSANEQLKQLGLADATIKTYQQRTFSQIIRRYEKEGDYQYRQEIMNELLFEAEKQFCKGLFSRKTRNWRRRGVKILQEIHEKGSFQWKLCNASFSPGIPHVFEDTVSDLMQSLSISKKYRKEVLSIITRFCLFLQDRNILDFQHSSPADLRDFLAKMHEARPKSMDKVVTSLKKLFRFLGSTGKATDNYWIILSAPRSRDHSVKPAIPQAEILTVICEIDRGKKPGKRDFAILSLAATTGLRAGDIASLKLTDIFWKDNEIRLSQGKTGHRLVLPLQSSVRDALSDYILNERPKSTSNKVFLRNIAPFLPFRDGVSIASIFRRYLKKANIQHYPNDGKTFHGIRRSLGTTMVSKGIPVTTVSQVLGHQEIRSTRQYVSMDVDGLRRCTLSMKTIGGGI